MKIKTITSLLLTMSLIFYAEAQTLPSPASIFQPQLIFGSGGGVTGMVREYRLHENGKLFVQNSTEKQAKELKTITKDSTDALFKEARNMFSKTKSFKQPGNIYTFIKLKEKKKLCEMTWGSATSKPPVTCKPFYDRLIKMAYEK